MSNRTFGIEIECGHPSKDYDEVLSAMQRAGYPASLGPARNGRYGVGSDGSGIEVKTPILKGKRGFQRLEKVMDFLFDYGCYVTKRDGMHTHVGAPELLDDKEATRTLARTWYNNQELIARMCSSHRLKAYSCNPLIETEIKVLGNHKQAHYYEPPGRHYQKHWGSRRRGLNFTALPEHGTVEFRIHEGCLDATKAVAWVKFCQALVDHAVTERKVLECAKSKTAFLDAVGVPEDARARLWPHQPQMPLTGKRVRRRAKSKT